MWFFFSLLLLQARPPFPTIFERISPNEGLSQSSIFAILQDKTGFMWFATARGLNQYDGYRFTSFTFDPRDPTTISDSFVTCLYEDRDEVLWAGTFYGGLNRFNRRTETFTAFRHDPADPLSISQNRVYALLEDRTGVFWVGTGKGLNQFDRGKGQFRRYLHDPQRPTSLSDDRVRALWEDREGNLWIGTENGLNRLDRQADHFIRYRHDPKDPNSLSNNEVFAIMEDRQGSLWVGTRGGLNRMERESGRFFPYHHDPSNPNGLSHDEVVVISEDREGRLWLGTTRGGLNRFDPESGIFVRYKADSEDPHALTHPHIFAVTEDRTGLLWIGTLFGLCKLNPNAAQFGYLAMEPAQAPGSGHNLILSIHEDRTGLLWVGTHEDGLKRIDRKAADQMVHYQHDPADPNSLSNNQVWAIHESREGWLWLGTSAGLNRFDPTSKRFLAYRHEPDNPGSLSHDVVFSLHEERLGGLWIGTGNGLNRLDDPSSDHFIGYRHDPDDAASLGPGNVWALHEDREGRLWVGTYGGGLNRLDPCGDGFVHYRNDPSRPDSLSHDELWCIYEDDRGLLWIGTAGGGLNRFDPRAGRFTHYRKKQGLIDDVVYGILGDAKGGLWLSTNQGLARFDPRGESFRSYDVRDGLQGNEFNAGAYFQSSSGEMFFGGVSGLNAFFPEDIRVNPTAPAVVLTDFLLFGTSFRDGEAAVDSPLGEAKTMATDKTLVLTHRQDVFSFEFAALDFSNPQKNQYAYKLEGFDRDWTSTGAGQRIATYTRLSPGAYSFRVKGSNSDGVWNQEGAAIRIKVLPPPWKTWWALSLYPLGFSLLVFAFVRLLVYRKKLAFERLFNAHLLQVDQLKDDFLQRASHELRAPLDGISALAESMMEGATGDLATKTRDHLAMIAASGQRLAGLVEDILDFSRLKHRGLGLHKLPVDLHSLTDVILNLSRFLICGKNLELVNDIDPGLPLVEADENRLKQIMHNLVAKVAERSHTGSVRVTAAALGKKMEVCVSDSGRDSCPKKITPQHQHPYRARLLAQSGHGKSDPGLALTRRLVALHGGQTQFDAPAGKGTTLSFTLPLSRETRKPLPHPPSHPAEQLPIARKQPQGQDSFHILVVDDERVNRQVLVNLLGLRGYRVTEVADGRTALRLLASNSSIDLVLLDILMPGPSGYEVCRQIRQQRPTHELPVVFLTAGNQRSDWAAGFAAGGNDHLTKPVFKEELLARVAFHLELLEIHRGLDAKVEEKTREVRALHDLKNKFFTNISHELRTPLTLIFGPLEDLIENIAKLPEDRRRKQLLRIQANAGQLARLIDQLLDVSKLEAGRMELHIVEDNIVSLVKKQVLAFSSWAERKQIALVCHFERQELRLPFDPDKLEKILGNLLSNAMKFTGKRGKVLIAVRQEGAWLRISIKDTGRGIPADQLPYVFDRFYQCPAEPRGGSPGGGIGLSLAKELARLHGGDILVRSEPGFGSEFILALPKRMDPAQAETLTREPPPLDSIDRKPSPLTQMVEEDGMQKADMLDSSGNTGSPATVLIVEDHPDLRAYLGEILRPDHGVLAAIDGQQGLALAIEHRPQLIISDIMMPKIDGHELCRILKNHKRTRHIPIILLTVKSSPENKLAGLERGADDYLTKPFSARELLARVRNLITTRQKLREQFSGQFILQPSQTVISSADEVFLQKAKTVVDRHLGDSRFDVEAFADEMGASIRHFRRGFKELTGHGPAEFIRQLRLDYARRLLGKRAGSVAEIAGRAGFITVRHFSRLFRLRFGMNPSSLLADAKKKWAGEDDAPSGGAHRKPGNPRS